MARTKKQDTAPAPTSSTSSGQKRAVKKKSVSATSNAAHLQKMSEAAKRKYLKSKKTSVTYEGYIKRMFEWWDQMLTKDQDTEVASSGKEGVVEKARTRRLTTRIA